MSFFVLFSAVCKQNDIIILSDEIYGMVGFDNKPNISIAKVRLFCILENPLFFHKNKCFIIFG